ncbi:MAG: hypothetical protein J7M10_00310 [Candidatus Cloacimonetes bacterium]|nr:hypothetical protein [Candidatus Cloacimonadota bacterium]
MDQKQQSQNELFNTIDTDSIEENLITVDQTSEELEKVKMEIQSDAGDKGEGTQNIQSGAKEESTEPGNKPEIKQEPKKPDTIQVDNTQAAGGEQKSEEIKDDKKLGGTPNEGESSVYLHAASLQDKGVLPNFNLDDIKDLKPAEALDKIDEHIAMQIKESISTGIDQYKKSLSPMAQDFLKSLDKGIPFETVRDIISYKDRYASISEKDLKDNEELQKETYSESLRMKGFTEAKIGKFVEKAVQDEELFEESKDGLVDINAAIEKEEKDIEMAAKANQEAREKQNEKTRANITKMVSEVKEIFPGIEVTKAEKIKIEEMMTVPVRYESRNGREVPISAAMDIRAKDPIAFEMKLNYFIKNGFFDGNKDLNKFAKKSESNATNKLLNSFGNDKHQSGIHTVEKPKTESEKEKEDVIIFPTNM